MQTEFRQLLKKSAVALLVGIPLFVISMLDLTAVTPGINQIIWIIVGCIVFLIMLYSGRHFYIGAWLAFKSHNANMNTLVSVATGPAWLYSMIVSIWPSLLPPLARHVYFDTPMTVIGLLVLGAALELRAGEKTAEGIKQLAELQPSQAQLIKNDHKQQTRIERITIGDIIEVRPEETIPMDGIIVTGTTQVNAAKLSPLQQLVAKNVADKVYAGTVNVTNKIRIKVLTTYKNNAVNVIVDQLKQSQNTKPAISKIADKVAGIFSPFVLIVSFITAMVWMSFGPSPQIAYMLTTFMAVLLIACPCALGLAAPISVAVGLSKAAHWGVLLRQSDALQAMKSITTLVIDQLGKDAKFVVNKLQKRKLKIIYLATTQEQQLEEQLSQLGITEIKRVNNANEIVDFITALKDKNEIVGALSDGVHNKDLLEAANVGIALGMESYKATSADVAIIGESFYGLLDAFTIAKATLSNIKQNLTGAFIYNSLGIPIAAGVFYPLVGKLLNPILAGALMASSSLVVILNANRLRLVKPLREKQK